MSGNLSRSMRENYDTHGVDEYYKIVGSSYRNPHFPGIKQCINVFMNKWWQNEHKTGESALVCDLACGSGEITIALQEWWAACQSPATPAPSNTTRPPVVPPARPVVARPAVARPGPKPSGSPLVAPFPNISSSEPPMTIVATDPYTADAYRTRTGRGCLALSFQDVAQDGLPDPSRTEWLEERESTAALESIPEPARGLVLTDPERGQERIPNQTTLEQAREPEPKARDAREEVESNTNVAPEFDSRGVRKSNGNIAQDARVYDLVMCSFALHLLHPSALYALLSTLSYGARWLVVLEPHKKPEIKDGWGWTVWDVAAWTGRDSEVDFVRERVHCRVYKSTYFA